MLLCGGWRVLLVAKHHLLLLLCRLLYLLLLRLLLLQFLVEKGAGAPLGSLSLIVLIRLYFSFANRRLDNFLRLLTTASTKEDA